MMNRTERLKRYCQGRTKTWVAEKKLGIRPQLLSYLVQIDIDKLVQTIDSLEVEPEQVTDAA